MKGGLVRLYDKCGIDADPGYPYHVLMCGNDWPIGALRCGNAGVDHDVLEAPVAMMANPHRFAGVACPYDVIMLWVEKGVPAVAIDRR